MAELKPCPFCGCKAIYEVEREDVLIGRYPQIFCNGCKMSVEVENDSMSRDDATIYNYLRDKVLKAWNRRANNETKQSKT